MKNAIIAAVLAASSFPVWATHEHGPEQRPSHNANATASNSNINANISSNSNQSSQSQHQTANGGSGGTGGAGGVGIGGMGGSAYGGTGGSATGGNATNGSVNGNEANNASQQVSVSNSNPRQTAQAANVTIMPTAVCSGSTGGGASSAAFGVSFGTSWTDANCMLLEQVRTTAVILEDPETASEMMCAVEAYRDARARLGKPCRTKLKAHNTAPAAQVEYTDPYIRHRLGLPPLTEVK